MNILYIKATPRTIEDSWSLKMAEFFRQEYQTVHPDHIITELSLYDAAIPFLSQQDLANMMQEEKGEFAYYVDQFLAHDKYIVAAPFWNLSFPAVLHAYLDRIIAVGKTFYYSEEGPKPLCPGKKCAFFTGRGGFYPEDSPLEYGLSYWKKLSELFLGLQTSQFTLDGTQVLTPEELNVSFEEKKKTIGQSALRF